MNNSSQQPLLPVRIGILGLFEAKFQARLRLYRSQHKTLGCKITHMIGVPLIAASFPVLLINRKLAMRMQSAGWALQFAGHYIFEGNKPVFLEAKDPLTALAAVVFVTEHWKRVFTRQPLVEGESEELTGAY